ATSEAARLQRRRRQKPANVVSSATSRMVPSALTNHGSTALGLVGGGSTAIPTASSTTQATAPIPAQRVVIGSSRRLASRAPGAATDRWAVLAAGRGRRPRRAPWSSPPQAAGKAARRRPRQIAELFWQLAATALGAPPRHPPVPGALGRPGPVRIGSAHPDDLWSWPWLPPPPSRHPLTTACCQQA